MQSKSSFTYPDILRWASRGILAALLACMPWATLSPAASPPSQWAVLMHLAAMAVIALLACTAFATLRGRAGAVMFVFAFSALMEWLQHFSPVRQVLGAGGDRKVSVGIHIVPPKHIGTGEVGVNFAGAVPDLRRLHQFIRLAPELYFAFFPEIPAVTYDTVLRWGLSR